MNITAQQLIDIPDHLSHANMALEINKIMRNNMLQGLNWFDPTLPVKAAEEHDNHYYKEVK